MFLIIILTEHGESTQINQINEYVLIDMSTNLLQSSSLFKSLPREIQ